MSLFKGIQYFLLSDNSKQKTLKAILGFYPVNFALYEQAFTHKSITSESDNGRQSNERLEFLGDAVLGAIIAEYFFQKFPLEDEGFLTKIRSKLVSRKFLNQLSVDLGLDSFLETSIHLNRSVSIYGDAFEALIGAIYLDKGYLHAKKFLIDKVIRDYVDIDQLIATETNFKSKLIEFTQYKKTSYQFDTSAVETEDNTYFKCELKVGGQSVSRGEGNSKKAAEQEAAKRFFESLESTNKKGQL